MTITYYQVDREEVARKLKTILGEEDNILVAVLFGSVLRHDKVRDIDILVYTRKPLQLKTTTTPPRKNRAEARSSSRPNILRPSTTNTKIPSTKTWKTSNSKRQEPIQQATSNDDSGTGRPRTQAKRRYRNQ